MKETADLIRLEAMEWVTAMPDRILSQGCRKEGLLTSSRLIRGGDTPSDRQGVGATEQKVGYKPL